MDQGKPSSLNDALQISRFKNAVVLSSVAVLVVVLVLAGVVTMQHQTWMISNRQAVMSSYELSAELEKPMMLLKDAENAEQAYLLTGDESCLKPINKAADELVVSFDRMERQFHSDEKAVQQLKTLRDYYDRELSQLRHFNAEREKTAIASVTPVATRSMINEIAANSHDVPLTIYRQQRQFRMAAGKELLRQTETSTIELLCLVGFALVGVTGASAYAIFQLKARDMAIEMVHQVVLETVATQEKLAAVLSSMDEGLCLLDEKGKLTYINQAGERLLGYDEEEILDADMHELLHNRLSDGNDCPAHQCPLRKVMVRSVAHHAQDDSFVRKGGSMLPVHYITSPLVTSGATTGTVLAFFDISERQLAEAKLKESEALFRQLAENIRDIFWIANPDSSKFFYVSPAFEEITGRSRDSIESNPRSFWDSLDRRDRRKAYWDFKGFDQGDGPREAEYRVIRPDGEVRWIATKVFPIYNEHGEMVRSCGVARDINDKKEAERRVSEFYSTVSHELRSPLTSIRGALGLIEGGIVGAASEQVLSFVTIARSESDRLIRLINNILDLRKIEAGHLEPKLTAVLAQELVESTLSALSAMASAGLVELIAPERTAHLLSVDRDLISQVLINLVANAIKFSPEGGKVTVHLRDDEAHFLRFEVEDHGPGIAASQAHKLFGKFQQLDSSDTRSKGGTGLGLAISKAIVEQHAGAIGFDSVEGQGATFWFKLPLLKSAGEIKHQALVFSSDGVLSARLSGIATLDLAGSIKVASASSLDHATRLLKEGSFDVLILDIGHSPEAAFALLAKMPTFKRAIPVIVVSGEPIKNGAYGDAFILDGIVDPLDGPTFSQAIAESIAHCQAKWPQVLIVEDDPATRAVVKLQIADLGMRCLEAHDGEHALELVLSHTPDLIVLDVGLPKLDGFEFIAALRKAAKRVPVIVYTARDLSSEDKEALSLGLTRYLTKSQNSVDDLLAAVRELLSGIVAAKS